MTIVLIFFLTVSDIFETAKPGTIKNSEYTQCILQIKQTKEPDLLNVISIWLCVHINDTEKLYSHKLLNLWTLSLEQISKDSASKYFLKAYTD